MEYTYCRCLPIETEILCIYSFVKCSSFKLIIKGNKEVHLQEKQPIVTKTLTNIAAAPFEQVITDSFRKTATLAKICSRTQGSWQDKLKCSGCLYRQKRIIQMLADIKQSRDQPNCQHLRTQADHSCWRFVSQVKKNYKTHYRTHKIYEAILACSEHTAGNQC